MKPSLAEQQTKRCSPKQIKTQADRRPPSAINDLEEARLWDDFVCLCRSWNLTTDTVLATLDRQKAIERERRRV